MELVKGNPFFCKTKSKCKAYKYLNKDISCDILIVGGGIDGSIANYYLSKSYDVVLAEGEIIGHKCTTCATALLEYQLDNFAEDLKKYLTEEEIINIYKLGQYSIDKIAKLVKELNLKCEFKKSPSFVFSTSASDKDEMQKEFNFRQTNGFDVHLIDENNNPFPFELKCGIYAQDGGAEFNPYLYTKGLIENSQNQTRIFEHTKIVKVEILDDNNIIASTNYGHKIFCKKIIYATGFDNSLFPCTEICTKFLTFTVVTNQLPDFTWYNKTLLQDNLIPYHYIRLLPDSRIMFGGEDIPYSSKDVIKESVANKKYDSLIKSFYSMFPHLQGICTFEHKFCGVFGSTKNNLGVISKGKSQNEFYFLSCGANGIINAMFGIELLQDLITKKPNNLENIFSLYRKDLM